MAPFAAGCFHHERHPCRGWMPEQRLEWGEAQPPPADGFVPITAGAARIF